MPEKDWLDELPLHPGPPWLSMATRALDMATWLVVDDRYEVEVGEKDRLMAERPADVFAALPGTEGACVEVCDAVTDWMAANHPDRLDLRVGHLTDLGCHPLDLAARLVQEDLCVMVEHDDGTYRLDAASVCFPSHWRLREKLGRSVAEIHAPVHHYDDELRGRVDRFFGRLRDTKPVVRRNLSIHNHDDLYRPEPHESPASFRDSPDRVWLRSERQTLVRLPRTRIVLFTIKTQQCCLHELNARPEIAHRLSAKLHELNPELERLGEDVPFPRWLADWLAAR
ncbi:MAG: DUF3445 domain-containing protein [Actinobacteria bacterium]|nr:DUF3445 domain-containing protein [Actinomycetota bacterium]